MIEVETVIDFLLGTKAFELSASIENLSYLAEFAGKSVVGFGSYFHFL